MALTISNESASYYSASNYQNSLQKSGSDYSTNSGGYYNISDASVIKNALASLNSSEAATYDKVTDLYNYAKNNFELSNLSIFDSVNKGGVSFESITNVKNQAQMQYDLQQISMRAELESIAGNPASMAMNEPALKTLYELMLEKSSARSQYIIDTIALQSSISSYMRAENNFQSTIRIIDQSV